MSKDFLFPPNTVQHLSWETFWPQASTLVRPESLVIVPDTISQLRLQEMLPKATVLRRDQWLDGPAAPPVLLPQQLEWASLVSSAIDALQRNEALECPPSTYLSPEFPERFLEFFDECVGTGLWSEDAWARFFKKLPNHPMNRDLSSLCRIFWSQRNQLQYPPDSIRFLSRLQNNAEETPATALFVVGFHRLSAVEKELLLVSSRKFPVVWVDSPEAKLPTQLTLRWFTHYWNECHWVKQLLDRFAAERNAPARIGLIVPPESHYRDELTTMLGVAPQKRGDEAHLVWLERLLLLWRWHHESPSERHPGRKFEQHAISKQLRALQPGISCSQWAVEAESPQALLHTAYEKLGTIRTDDACLIQLFDLLQIIHSLRLSSPVFLKTQFWLQLLERLRAEQRKRLPSLLSYGRTSIEFLDYRCAKLSSASLHLAPGMSTRIYPPPSSEHPLFPESSREFLARGEEALPFLTAQLRAEDEVSFFHSIVSSRNVILSGSRETPSETDASPSLLLSGTPEMKCTLNVKQRRRTGLLRFNPSPQPHWGKPQKQLHTEHPVPSPRVSPTSLEAFVRCPYQFYLSHVIGLKELDEKEVLDARTIGKVIHAWLERLLQDGADPNDLSLLETVCEKNFPEDMAPSPRLRSFFARVLHLTWSEAVTTELQRLKTLRRSVRGTELKINEQFSEGQLTVTGRIDRIDDSADGPIIVDYKTGKRELREKDKAGTGSLLQPFLYIEALRKQSSTPIAGAELVYLKEEDPVTFLPAIDFLPRLQEITASIHSGSFPPQPENKKVCSQCQFLDGCPLGNAP